MEAALLNDLIAQLLSLSAIQYGRETDRSQIVHLQQVVHELAEDARFEASRRKCTVTFQPIAEDYSVRGHERLLRGAIENVVRNAIHYSGDGGVVEIQISTELRHEVSYAVISVVDNGPGIPQEDLRKIFYPFYRVDESRRRSTGGFGIGLSIVERSIRLHAGKIIAANRDGGGLIVAMYLPLEKEVEN
jgi:two-component system sensor histidine kinase CpxA